MKPKPVYRYLCFDLYLISMVLDQEVKLKVLMDPTIQDGHVFVREYDTLGGITKNIKDWEWHQEKPDSRFSMNEDTFENMAGKEYFYNNQKYVARVVDRPKPWPTFRA